MNVIFMALLTSKQSKDLNTLGFIVFGIGFLFIFFIMMAELIRRWLKRNRK